MGVGGWARGRVAGRLWHSSLDQLRRHRALIYSCMRKRSNDALHVAATAIVRPKLEGTTIRRHVMNRQGLDALAIVAPVAAAVV